MSIQVTACLNPFSGERKEFSFEQGITINEIIRNLDALNAVNTGWRVMIDDEIITDFERVPEEGQRVYIKLVPEGDNNKDSGAGMKIAGGLLTVVGAILAFTPASALGFCLIGCGVGMFNSGVVLYNTDIPSSSDREKPEQDPSIRGSRNQMRPYGKVPVLLGKRRIYADACANPYTWVDSEGAIWLHQLFCVAQKDIQIDTSTLKIDETLLKDYSATGDISRVLDQSNPDPLIQMKISYGDSTPPLYDKCVHEIQLNTVLKHQTEDEQDGSVIRTTPAKTTKINVDVFFYNGLGKYNDEGNVVSTSVELKAEYKKSTDPDSAYQLLGYFSEGSNTISGSELKTKRYAITKDNLTADSYTVKISRVTADSTDTKIIDTVYVGSIRAANNDTPVRSARCQQVTLIGLKIKASEKLNNIVEQLNFVAQSKMPVYNSQSHQWTNALTSNPASAAMYAMQGEVAQQRLSNSDIDLDSFAALYTWCANHDYECNAYITDDMTINDLLSSIASTCRAEILRMNGKITVIQDIAKDSFVQLFTPRNSHDYKETMALADIPDVLKMGIVDKTNGYAENEVPVYNTPSGNPVSGVEPQTSQSVPLWGVTDSVQARKLAMYNYAVSKHRFTVVKFSCDFEYLMCRKGDWIKYAGDIALAGLKQGRIEAVDGQTLILDEQVTMESGSSYAVRIRKSDGTAALCNVQTVVGTSNEITISGQIPSGVEGCLFAFGITGNETIDLIVTDIQCGEDLSADLTCVEYAPEIFGVDDPDFVLPDFVNKLSSFDSVVDPGDVNKWRIFVTYNDSDSKPETPTGGGTSGSWHLQQTNNSKWISTKTAASIYEGEWSAPMPTGKKVMNVLVPDGEIGNPDNVTGISAIARQNEIIIQWNLNADDGLHNSIANYVVQVSKDSGNTWNTGNQVTGNSTSYIFNRDTNADGFPERETFATWRVRVTAVNIYGKKSTPTVQPIDASSYGTWTPVVPSLSKIPDENGINFEWPAPIGANSRTLYGSNQYELAVTYNGTDRPVITTTELNAVYTFDRDSQVDGYPEAVHDEGHTGLDLFSFKLKVINESGNFRQSNAQSFSSAETENYGTWIPVASSFIKSVAAEYGIDYEWTRAAADGNVLLYGSNVYKLRVYCGNTLKATIEKGTLSAIYNFDRATDGYPEKQDVTGAAHTLDEYTATIEVINVSGNSATSQTTTTTDSTYLGWKPDVPTITTRSSGRALTINPVNPEQRYGKIRYRYLINNLEKDGNNYYLPTPTADYLSSEDNYRDTTKQDIPLVADSPYTQTVPFKGQNARAYKLCSWEGTTTQDEYDEAEKKSITYSSTDPSTGQTTTTRTMNVNDVPEIVKYWYDSTEHVHYASFETPMPNAVDTTYRFKVQAFNSVADNIASDLSDPVSVTAKTTAAYDVVNGAITANALAPDAVTTDKIAAGSITAEKIFVRALAAISANLGAITDGSLVGNQNNYWYLSDEYSDGHLVHRAGDFQVGTPDGDYIKCQGYIDSDNVLKYSITMHASKFEITAIGTVVKGSFFVSPSNATIDQSTGIPNSYYAKIDSNGVIVNGDLKATNLIGNVAASAIGVYVEVATAAGTAAKTGSLKGFTLFKGARTVIKLNTANTAADATLNINGTGAKTIKINDSNTTSSNFTAGYWNAYYDGTNWRLTSYEAYNAYNSYVSTVGYNSYGLDRALTCSTAAGTAAKTVSLSEFSLIKGARLIINLSNTNTASNPTLNVNSKGAKAVYINGQPATTSNWTSGYWNAYYDGSYWQLTKTETHDSAHSVQSDKTVTTTSFEHGSTTPIESGAIADALNWTDITSDITLTCSRPDDVETTGIRCYMQKNLIHLRFSYHALSSFPGYPDRTRLTYKITSSKFTLNANSAVNKVIEPHNHTGSPNYYDNYEYVIVYPFEEYQIDCGIGILHDLRSSYGSVDIMIPVVTYDTTPSVPDYSYRGAYCTTASGTQAKSADFEGYVYREGNIFPITFTNANSYNGKITLNVNSTGAKDVWIDGTISSSSNKTIPAGIYFCRSYNNHYDIQVAQNVSSLASQADYTRGTAYCTTAGNVAAKVASMRGYVLQSGATFPITFTNTNSAYGLTLSVNGTAAKTLIINGYAPTTTLPAGTYLCRYDGTYYHIDTQYAVPSSRGVNEVTSDNMQSVSSNAVYNYAKKDLWVKVEYKGTSITVTNNLGRSDLNIEAVFLGNGETFSYFISQPLSSSVSPQSITSYNSRVPSNYDSIFVSIIDSNLCVIGSGIVANLASFDTGAIIVHC